METTPVPSRTTSATIAPGLYLADPSPRSLAARSFPRHRTQHPRHSNSYAPTPLRLAVPADQHLLLWTTPHSQQAQNSLDYLPVENQAQLLQHFLQSFSDSTRQSYSAGLLRFTQFCDRLHISEHLRMPAPDALLSAFIANASGSQTGECVCNWLHGLCAWHILNRAEWHGRDPLVVSLQRTADKLRTPFHRPLRQPITRHHLLSLHNNPHLSSPRGVPIWAAALTAFWGCRRLGELLPPSASFSPSCHPSRSSDFTTSYVNGSKVLTFHIPCTKTSAKGDQCILTATNNIFCPIAALENHLRINSTSHPTHLFAYLSDNSFATLTHYRIGSTLELLASGVAPECIMKLGGWTSLCFLLYWRRLDLLVPDAITRSWASRRLSFAQKFHLPNPT
ncbi:hypothetical protein D9615_010132 [Tricholomella constricta]|uniref:Core-binding (CB) domain-containing protein n=1 Tax=Tricholomella constricta TaxID=117010 RepID=A0A8H5GWU4_9AGAR|nr:hypothetical protein D9615_010132 [Tricholomella constricta]